MNHRFSFAALSAVLVAGLTILACTDDSLMQPPAQVADIAEVADNPFSAHDVSEGQCMGDDAQDFNEWVSGFSSTTSPFAFNCTANDVSLANAHVAGGSGAIECVGGQVKTVDIVADVVLNSESARTDIGIWIADGELNPETAESGSCDFFHLPPGTPDGIPADADGDQCGDMDNAETLADFPLDQISFLCEDPDEDGFVEIASCVSWTIPGGDRVCPTTTNGPVDPFGYRAGTLPANKSKCNCEPFLVPVTILGTLTLQKTVVNDDNGTAVEADFQASIGGVGDVDWDVATELVGGDYTASETVVAGYTAGDWGGDCAADGSITLASGQNAVCTITNNDDPAFLILNKTVVNDDGGTAVANDFQASIGGIGNVAWGASTSVGAGTFTAAETVVTGYTADAWGGDCAADGSVTLALGETKTCTIVNRDNPAGLILLKTVINDDGGTAVANDFQASIGGIGNVAWGASTSVGAGTFTAAETVVTGYTADAWGGDCAADGSVTLALGENKTCTIINRDDPAFLILNKTVVNDDGGTAVANDFQASIGGIGNVAWGASTSVGAGTFTAAETVVAGYTADAWGGDCAADGSVTLALGETKTCTIVNRDDPAGLILLKTVINDDGGTAVANDFQASIGGIGNVAWGASTSVGAGTFTAAETVVNGYTADAWGGDCAADGSVTLALGENKTCTIINRDDPAFLILNKTVVNDDGGTAVANDFQASIGGIGNVAWGASTSVGAGTFTAAETVVAGYTADVWGGDCAADGSVTLALGETKTCTIVNRDNPAHLTLVKVVVNDDGGGAVATDWTLFAAGPTPISGAGGADSDVSAGTYTLSESAGPPFYTAGSWVCVGGTQVGDQVTLGLGGSATCTITNDDVAVCGPGDRLTSVSLEVTALSSSPLDIAWTDDNGNLKTATFTPVDGSPSEVGEVFTIVPDGGATFFDSQNLRFKLDGEVSKNLKVHLSCSDDPAIGDIHFGDANGDSAELTKTAFGTMQF